MSRRQTPWYERLILGGLIPAAAVQAAEALLASMGKGDQQ